MPTHSRLFILVAVISTTQIAISIFPIQPPPQQANPEQQIQHIVDQALRNLQERVNYVNEISNNSVHRLNESMGLAHSANGTATRAFQTSNDALTRATQATTVAATVTAELERIRAQQANVTRQADAGITNLNREYERLSAALTERVAAATNTTNTVNREHMIQRERAKIQEKQQRGVYEQVERIRAQASVEVESERWKKIHEIIRNPKTILTVAIAIVTIILCYYIIRYGIPALMNYLTLPRVVVETSRSGWFTWSSKPSININDLLFAPTVQKELSDLLERVQTAKKYNEPLPNVLFYGAPGTGKTAFAKALAYASGLDYALTSGTEFAKITDLDNATHELRKLLQWAQTSKKGLIVFIDEAESLFANRKLPTTPKNTQDFINTFLALISEQSQKNVMFIFVTNHPFKLDDAITNRIGINVEFPLPDAVVREKILARYLIQNARENDNLIVDIQPDVIQMLSTYAQELDGFSPRALKFVAEEMIVKARRQEVKILNKDIARAAIDEAKRSLQQTIQWQKEREKWVHCCTQTPQA